MGAKTKIEWCDTTWSPVTGCLHGCDYCYARGIAHRFGGFSEQTDFIDFGEPTIETFREETKECHILGLPKFIERADGKVQQAPYPYLFDPTFHRYRLDIPAHWREPRNIFVCSMADLFGDWVPDEWIRQVFLAAGKAMQHNYLFLTKNPKRYLEVDDIGINVMFKNIWLGSTVADPGDPFLWVDKVPCHSFVSLEPLMCGGWEIASPAKWPEWVIIGAMTGPGAKKHQPKAEWVADIVAQCKSAGVPVFMKDSLVPVVGEGNMLREFPRGLQK